MKELYVLPGGGSPYNTRYSKVYKTIKDGGDLYNVKVRVLDYVGIGHETRNGFKENDIGFNYNNVVNKVKNDLINANSGSTLMGRSYGCNIILFLLDKYPEVLSNFDKIIFWGIARPDVWEEFVKMGVSKWNETYKVKGAKMAHDFFDDEVNPYNLIKSIDKDRIRGKIIYFACGSKDKYSDYKFNSDLLNYFNKIDAKASLKCIDGVMHELIAEEVNKQQLDEYYNILFN